MHLNVFAANRKELWTSMYVVTAAFFASHLWPGLIPVFIGAIVLGGAVVVGLLCAVNAALDIDEMEPVETWVAVFWLIAMLILTPLTLYGIATIREFPNR